MTGDRYTLTDDQKTAWTRRLKAQLAEITVQQNELAGSVKRETGKGSTAELNRFVQGNERVLRRYLETDPEIGEAIANAIELSLADLQRYLDASREETGPRGWHFLFPQAVADEVEVEVQFEGGVSLAKAAEKYKNQLDNTSAHPRRPPRVLVVAPGRRTRAFAIAQFTRKLEELETTVHPEVVGASSRWPSSSGHAAAGTRDRPAAQTLVVAPWTARQLASLARKLAKQNTGETSGERFSDLADWLPDNPDVVPPDLQPGRAIAWLWFMARNHPWTPAAARDAWPTATWQERTRHRHGRLARLGEPLMEHLYAHAWRSEREPWSSWTTWSEDLALHLVRTALRSLLGEDAGRDLRQLVAALKPSKGPARKQAIHNLERAVDASPAEEVVRELVDAGLLRRRNVDGTTRLAPLDLRLAAAWAARGLAGTLDLSSGWHRLADPAAGPVVDALAERGTTVAHVHDALRGAPASLRLDARLWELSASLHGALGAWEHLEEAWREVLLGCAVDAWSSGRTWHGGWSTRARKVLLAASRVHRDRLPYVDATDVEGFLHKVDPEVVAFAHSWWARRQEALGRTDDMSSAIERVLRQLTPWQRPPFAPAPHPHGRAPWRIHAWLENPADAAWALRLARDRGNGTARDLLSGKLARWDHAPLAEPEHADRETLRRLWNQELPLDLLWSELEPDQITDQPIAIGALLDRCMNTDWPRWAPHVADVLRAASPQDAMRTVLSEMKDWDSDRWQRWEDHIHLLGRPIIAQLLACLNDLIEHLRLKMWGDHVTLTTDDPPRWPWMAAGASVMDGARPPSWERRLDALLDRRIQVAGWLHELGDPEPLRRLALTGGPLPPPAIADHMARLEWARLILQPDIRTRWVVLDAVRASGLLPADPAPSLAPRSVGARWADSLTSHHPPLDPTLLSGCQWIGHWLNDLRQAPARLAAIFARLWPRGVQFRVTPSEEFARRFEQRTTIEATQALLARGDEACWRDWLGSKATPPVEYETPFPRVPVPALEPDVVARVLRHARSFTFGLHEWLRRVRPSIPLIAVDPVLRTLVASLDDEGAWSTVRGWHDDAWRSIVIARHASCDPQGLRRWETATWLDAVNGETDERAEVLHRWALSSPTPLSDTWLNADPSHLEQVLYTLTTLTSPWAPEARRRIWEAVTALPLTSPLTGVLDGSISYLPASSERVPQLVQRVVKMLRDAGEESVVAATWRSPPAPRPEDPKALPSRELLFRAWTFRTWRQHATVQDVDHALDQMLARRPPLDETEASRDRWHFQWNQLLATALHRGSGRARELCTRPDLQPHIELDLRIRAAPSRVHETVVTQWEPASPCDLMGLLESEEDAFPVALEATRRELWSHVDATATDVDGG